LKIEDGKIMSLVGEIEGIVSKMPFHLECLRNHRGDRELRKRIRSVVSMIHERNGRNGG